MGIKQDIINNTISDLEKSFNADKEDLTAEQRQDFNNMKSTVKKSLDKQLSPLIDGAIIPLLEQVIALNKAVNKMNSNIPTALTAVGVGTAAAGPAGASAYSGSAPTTELSRITNDLANLKRKV